MYKVYGSGFGKQSGLNPGGSNKVIYFFELIVVDLVSSLHFQMNVSFPFATIP